MVNSWMLWNELYDTDHSLSGRLASVKEKISDFLLAQKVSHIDIVNICSGQARDILETLAEKRPGVRSNIYLIDYDKPSLNHAVDYANEHGIENIHIVHEDASVASTYIESNVPRADLIILVGVLGSLEKEAVLNIPESLKQLLKPEGTVIWSSTKEALDLTEDLQNAFYSAGYEKIDFVVGNNEDVWTVGVNKLSPKTAPIDLDKDLKLF